MSRPLYVPALTLPPQHRHRMVVLEPLNKLLQAKWDLLIPRFFFNFLCYLMYMFLFTAVAYHQPALEKVQQVGGGGGGDGAHAGGGRPPGTSLGRRKGRDCQPPPAPDNTVTHPSSRAASGYRSQHRRDDNHAANTGWVLTIGDKVFPGSDMC